MESKHNNPTLIIKWMKFFLYTFFQFSLIFVQIACKQVALEERENSLQDANTTISNIEPKPELHQEKVVIIETITGKLNTASFIEGEAYFHVDVNEIDYVFFNFVGLFGEIDMEGENVPKSIIVNNGREYFLNDSLKDRNLIIDYEKLSKSAMIQKYKIEPMLNVDTIRIVRKMVFK